MSLKFSPTVQICLSTAEDSENYFTGEPIRQPEFTAALPPGTYRIVDGQLFQIIEGPRRQKEVPREGPDVTA
jgi:hypothetical protein